MASVDSCDFIANGLDSALTMASGPNTVAFVFGIAPVTDPVIVNVSPNAPGALAGSTPWQCDVVLTPTNGTVNRVIVFVANRLTGDVEVAFDGQLFTPAFNGASTLVDNGAGTIHLRVVPNGGWVSGAKVSVHASSDMGGVAR